MDEPIVETLLRNATAYAILPYEYEQQMAGTSS